MPKENKLPRCIDIASANAKFCLDKAEFYAGKSKAKDAAKEAREWQEAGERWADTEELLRELAMYRNHAFRYPGIEQDVAENMRLQDYEY